jgi:hypothetical protein
MVAIRVINTNTRRTLNSWLFALCFVINFFIYGELYNDEEHNRI